MNELRKDYLLDRWVIIASGRAKRPMDFVSKCAEYPVGSCFFCPGNEKETPPEIGRIERDGKWIVRWFPNKFPATAEEQAAVSSGLLESRAAFGRHEVIVETPLHTQDFEELSAEDMAAVFSVCDGRIKELSTVEGVKYVLVFKNRGRDAGASLAHSHFQVMALSEMPTLVAQEASASALYRKEHGTCPFCDVSAREASSERSIWSDNNAVALAPYASRFPFEAWVMPKRHVRSFGELSPAEQYSFANAVKQVLLALDRMINKPPYNFYLHVSPAGEDLHFHMELCPKLSIQAGFELGSGMNINVVTPEEAARHYKNNL
ncbi:MAG: galactose-1-phosphate uridylyltransferase [Candidatus Altiarchaeota archaeon]|nr:galactose-1-phosphate uridylyltransferase [Candidatus Altiarchaeota archaeon]